VEEAAEVQQTWTKASREASSWRRREQTKFVIGVTVAAAVVLILTNARSIPNTAVFLVIAFVIGLLLAVPFGWYYDHLVRVRTRRLLVERLGGEGPHGCSIAIHPDVLRVTEAGVELAFSWSDATSVADAPEGVTITFKRGFVLARSRGFVSDVHRARFLRRVQELIPTMTPWIQTA
jgi:hypothetical protein